MICGQMTVSRFEAGQGATLVRAVRCKTWRCGYCGPRRRQRYCHAIAAAATAQQMVRILTLTLDCSKIPPAENPVVYIQGCWAELRLAIARKFGRGLKYIRVVEMREDGSHVHLHCLVNRYLPQAWLSREWAALGGGKIVDIRMVAPRRVAGYVAKYLAKALAGAQMYRLRRVTCSRGIVLLPRAVAAAQKWFFSRLSARMISVHHTAEKIKIDQTGMIVALDFVAQAWPVALTILKGRIFDGAIRFDFGFGA